MNQKLIFRAFYVALAVSVSFYIYILNKKSCENDTGNRSEFKSNLPIIYAITPTFARAVQKAELTRLSHVFRLVPNLFWVIIEDADNSTLLVKNFINRTGLTNRSVLLHAKTQPQYKLSKKDPHWSKPRGIDQRNLGLKWVRERLSKKSVHAIVYFMDDDNTYTTELFDEMSKIEKSRVGVWPVGLMTAMTVERPIVKNGKVIGFNSMWGRERNFSIDMAGFGISFNLLEEHPEALFSYEVKPGYQESEILRKVTTKDMLQPLASDRILVWHTRSEEPNMFREEYLRRKKLPPTNQGMLLR